MLRTTTAVSVDGAHWVQRLCGIAVRDIARFCRSVRAGYVLCSGAHSGLSVDSHSGLSANAHSGLSVDSHSGLSVDSHSGLSVNAHSGLSFNADGVHMHARVHNR